MTEAGGGSTKLKEGPMQALPRGWTRHVSSGVGGMNSVAENVMQPKVLCQQHIS